MICKYNTIMFLTKPSKPMKHIIGKKNKNIQPGPEEKKFL